MNHDELRQSRIDALMKLRDILRSDFEQLDTEATKEFVEAKKTGNFAKASVLHMQANIRRISYAKVWSMLKTDVPDLPW